eukprot:m.599827 g.599827  ORF g.599827 m.599827 type:complete len:97 (-) comp22428_c0_seq16:2169-2459(-)
MDFIAKKALSNKVSGFEKDVKNSLGMGKKKPSDSNVDDKKANAQYRAAEEERRKKLEEKQAKRRTEREAKRDGIRDKYKVKGGKDKKKDDGDCNLM